MFDHVSIGVRDLTRAKRFYDAVLPPLGYACLSEDAGALDVRHLLDIGLADAAGGTESHSDPSRPTLAAAGKSRATGSAPAWLEASAETVSPRLRLCELVVAGRAGGWARGRLWQRLWRWRRTALCQHHGRVQRGHNLCRINFARDHNHRSIVTTNRSMRAAPRFWAALS